MEPLHCTWKLEEVQLITGKEGVMDSIVQMCEVVELTQDYFTETMQLCASNVLADVYTRLSTGVRRTILARRRQTLRIGDLKLIFTCAKEMQNNGKMTITLA